MIEVRVTCVSLRRRSSLSLCSVNIGMTVMAARAWPVCYIFTYCAGLLRLDQMQIYISKHAWVDIFLTLVIAVSLSYIAGSSASRKPGSKITSPCHQTEKLLLYSSSPLSCPLELFPLH
jgi:hypothetical protein